jgi:hypothetical protein
LAAVIEIPFADTGIPTVLLRLLSWPAREWSLRMLRAAAALRVFHATYATIAAEARLVLQSAGQSVEDWDLPQDHPIFMEHLEGQFAGMFERTLSPEWPAAYAERCGLKMAAPLLAKCRSAWSTLKRINPHLSPRV